MRLALFEPDIPQNAGALIRLAACMEVGLDIIGPCGFVLSDRDVKRVSLDYSEYSAVKEYESWQNFIETIETYENKVRIVLLTTKSTMSYVKFSFKRNDIILLGRESAGVPKYIHEAVKNKITIPMNSKVRSMNVANAAAMVLSEAMRQTDLLPKK